MSLSRSEIRRLVRRLAWPAIAQQLLHTVAFLVDRGVLGHFDSDSLASMQMSGPLVWTSWLVLSAFSVGSIALIGRRVGAEDFEGAGSALRASGLGALGIGVIAATMGLLAIPLCLRLFGDVGPAARNEAVRYLEVSFLGMPAMLLSYTAAVGMQAAGDTRTPFVVSSVGVLLNVGLSIGLVFGLDMGARGAAIGSVSAMVWQAAVLWALLARRRPGQLSWRGRGGERDAWRRVRTVAGPTVAERLLQQVGFLGFVAMIGALGERAMAANQTLISVEAIAFLSADGFGIAAAALAAQSLGAKKPDQAEAMIKSSLAHTLGLLGLFALAFLLVPEWLLLPFSNDPDVLALAVPCLAIAAVEAPVLGVAAVMAEALRGAGDTRAALRATFVGGLMVRLAATYVFAFVLDLGLRGVWMASTLDWTVRAVILWASFRRGGWKSAQV